LVDRTRKEFSDDDVARIAGAYHAWRGETRASAYADVAGFCKAATTDVIRDQGYVLTPGRFVGTADTQDDEVPFPERFAALRTTLDAQFADADRLTRAIRFRLAQVVGNG